MHNNAKEKFPELYNYKFTKKQILTKGIKPIIIDPLKDPRLTPIGKFMRKNSLDELPNLFNVLKGEMSLVGPRPEPVQMLKYYTKKQKMAFFVKPGITGLAQINGRGLLSLQQTINYDLEYAKTRSISQDLTILFKTLMVVIKQTGAF
jgi:lipopolysaccharide/colanic/teichoic acid biosynthesis glycosyltransferase